MDIREYIRDNVIFSEYDNIAEMEKSLNEELWTADSVTGNGSGSYFFNRAKARECVLDNIDMLFEMAEEFGIDAATIGEKFLNEEWEYFDVSIRCCLLARCLSEVIEEMADEFEAAKAAEAEEED